MKEELLEIADGTRIPDYDEVADLRAQYPYWTYPAIALLNSGTPLSEEHRKELRMYVAAATGDAETRERLLGADDADLLDNFYGDEKAPELSTDSTIDAYLQKFGGGISTDPDKDQEQLDRMMSAPTIDYASMLAAEESAPDNTSPRTKPASAHAQQNEPQAPQKEQNSAKPRQSTDNQSEKTRPLSESLARVMIKNGNYAKALEIITALSLKNPEKSIYFADQIRFLRKLVIINANKKS